jgi:hypothetical protein
MRPKQIVVLALCACCALLSLASASGLAAQRIDMRVLLLGVSGNEPSFLAWEAQLRREGVPYDEILATPRHTPITESTLSTSLEERTQEAKYQAVVVAVGNLPYCEERGCFSALAAEEWAALQRFEATFHVRQISAYVYPEPGFGLNWPTFGGALEGVDASLTSEGLSVFPYLDGTVSIDVGTYGYEARPLEARTFTTLATDANGASLVGIFRHEDGREELVQTFDGNQYQLHTHLMRHGELAWVTRGTYLGDQRNYLELQVDDVFLPDDVWDPTTNRTLYTPEDAVRMTAEDVANAVEWSRSTGLRLDMVYNGGGSDEYVAEHGSDPLLSALRTNAATFGWINHTYDHPNLDCSTHDFIDREIEDNVTWAREAGFSIDAAELVTGEHSGLANLRPGNPGTIDPPWLDEATVAGTGGTLAAARWDYGVTATNERGETIASMTTVTTRTGESTVRLSWEAICKATGYKVYRRSSPEGAWSRLTTIEQPRVAFEDGGPVTVAFTDTGGSGTSASPPSTNGAALAPYGQNAAFASALEETSVTYIASDASKPYPQTPTESGGPTYAAGVSFVDGPARAIPRYPTNVYYNVATQAQLVDEYNYLYLPPELGGACVLSEVTTCRTRAATWEDVVASESRIMFTHMMGNDPRPHYFHQTNLAESEAREGAVLYPVVDAVRSTYDGYFASNAPIAQLTYSQIGDLLARQGAWATASARTVTGYIEGREVVVTNGGEGELPVPLSGTEVGSSYAGTRSGWDDAPRGTTRYAAATAWPAP